MHLIVLAQFVALVLSALLGLALFRHLRATQARRAAAFEDFAVGRGLQVYRSAVTAPVYRLSDEAGTIITVETPPAPRLPFRTARKVDTVTIALPGPRLTRGLVAMVAGVEAGPGDRGARLDRALRGLGAGGDREAVRVLPLGGAVALLADVPAGATPDLEAIRAALADPALRPEGGGTAMIALNPEGLHLRLGRGIRDPRALAPILDAMRALGAHLQAGERRRAA